MSPLLQMLLVGGGLLLVGGAGAGVLLLRLREREAALQCRLDAVGQPYVKSRPAEVGRITRRRVREPQPLVRRLARLFGCDLGGSDEGMRWYLVLPATLLVTVIASELTRVLLGEAYLLVVPPAWVMLSRSLWGWRRERRLGRLLSQFPDALAMIVRSVRVGIPVSEAVRVVAREAPEPTARSFGDLGDEVAIGVALDTALRHMAERTGLAEYRFFATAISLQAQTGGALAETLENLADVIRRRLALRSRGRALSSEARTSIAALAALPVLGGLGMYLLNPEYTGMLLSDSTGRSVFGLAVVALAVGLLTMRIMMSRVLS